MINNSQGKAKRTQKQPYTDVFTASMNETIDRYIKEANDILEMIKPTSKCDVNSLIIKLSSFSDELLNNMLEMGHFVESSN